jgi:hypothetical protein
LSNDALHSTISISLKLKEELKNAPSFQTLMEEDFCVALVARPKLLDRLKGESEMKTTKEQGVEARSLTHNTLGVKGSAGVPGWD